MTALASAQRRGRPKWQTRPVKSRKFSLIFTWKATTSRNQHLYRLSASQRIGLSSSILTVWTRDKCTAWARFFTITQSSWVNQLISLTLVTASSEIATSPRFFKGQESSTIYTASRIKMTSFAQRQRRSLSASWTRLLTSWTSLASRWQEACPSTNPTQPASQRLSPRGAKLALFPSFP